MISMLGPGRVTEDLPRLGGRRTSGRLKSGRAQNPAKELDPAKKRVLMEIMMIRDEHAEQDEHTNSLDYVSELLSTVLIVLSFFRSQLMLPFQSA
jgi:hypothetical protein